MSGQQIEHLVSMANQIALNFGEQRDPELAASRTAEHLQKFWTRNMRDQLTAYAALGEGELSPVVRQLCEQQAL
jgi:formate dehydrogenase subunit delta